MNAPKLVASIAVLVVAAFWAVVLIDYLGYVGELVLLVTPFIALFAIGTYGVIDALGVGPQGKGGPSRGKGRVGALGMIVLNMVAQGKNQQDIAAATSVASSVVEAKLDALKKAGYLSENGLSEKGFDLVKDSS